jgi:cysteinyl-tRNA synthetase
VNQDTSCSWRCILYASQDINEIAQNEAATGKRFVNYWMHNAFLTFHGEKVSKSKGGLYTLRELEALGYKPEHYRYLCLLAHYRKPLDFSLEALDSARNAYERLVSTYLRMRSDKTKLSSNEKVSLKYDSQFKEAVNNDLNLPYLHIIVKYRTVTCHIKMLTNFFFIKANFFHF